MPDSRLEIVTLALGQLQTNCYLVICPETLSALVIDPADQPEMILRAAERKHARIEQIVLTHAHLDHLAALPALKRETSAHLLAHRLEREMMGQYARLFGLRPDQLPPLDLDVALEGGEQLSIGSLMASIVLTPGHSPGSVSISMDGAVFTGDLLFAGGVGRVDLPGGDWQTLLRSIGLLLDLPDETIVYPGHGPSSTIGDERSGNPYLRLG